MSRGRTLRRVGWLSSIALAVALVLAACGREERDAVHGSAETASDAADESAPSDDAAADDAGVPGKPAPGTFMSRCVPDSGPDGNGGCDPGLSCRATTYATSDGGAHAACGDYFCTRGCKGGCPPPSVGCDGTSCIGDCFSQ